MKLRRLKRIGRRLAEVLRHDRNGNKINGIIPASDAASLYRALGEGCKTRTTYEEAVNVINQHIAAWARKVQGDKRNEWRAQFSKWSREAMQATKQSLKPHSPPEFTAQEMKQEPSLSRTSPSGGL